MSYSEELLSNLAPIAHKICIERGYEIEYINPQKEDDMPVYVELRDGSKFIPTKDEILQAWETLQNEVVPEQEILDVQVQLDNTNKRLATLEAQLNSIKDLLIKLNS